MKLELISWDRPDPPEADVLRKRLESEGFDVFIWSDPPRRTYEPHTHEHDECLWVTRGDIMFRINEKDYTLGLGDRLMLPAGTVHAAQAGPGGASYLIGQRRS